MLVIGAGVSIPDVIVDSDQGAMRDLKRQRFAKFKFSNEKDYKDALSKSFHLDPLSLPRGFEGKKLGLVFLKEDSTVPSINQQRLRELWQPDLDIEVSGGHFWGIVKTWWSHSSKIESFLFPEK